MSAIRLRYSSTSGRANRSATSSLRTSSKPAPRSSPSTRSGLAMLNGPGAGGGSGRPDVSTLDEAGRDGPEEGIAVRRAPDGQRQPTARPQDPAGLREGRRGNGHQHEPEPAEHPVDGVVVELDSLGVGRPVVDILYAELGSATARGFEHRRREVGRKQPAARADDRGGLEPGLPTPAASSSSVSSSFARSSRSIHSWTGAATSSMSARRRSQVGAIVSAIS